MTTEFIGTTRADSGFRIPDSGLSKPACPAIPALPKPKSVKTGMPAGFGVSQRVREWADKQGYTQLDRHLDAFIRKVEAKGYTYVNWDSGFMEAIREDWAKLRGRTPNGSAPPPEVGMDPDSRSSVEAEATVKGIGPWNELAEQWPTYKARVRATTIQRTH